MTALPKPRAVIFDWDDTIVDNWYTSLAALNAAFKHMGAPEWTDEEARRNAMYSGRDLFKKLFGDRWEEADKAFIDNYKKLVMDNILVHEGAKETLQILADNDVTMFVISNKRGHLLRHEVTNLGLADFFNKIVGAGDADKDKPDPAPIYLALEGTGITPGPDVWFVGDSQTDLICARAAGCTAILIETKLPPEELLVQNPPHVRLKDHSKIMEYLRPYFT